MIATNHLRFFISGISAVLLMTVFGSIALSDDADFSTPTAAAKAYAIAESKGDAQAMKAAAVYDDAWEKVIDARAAGSRAQLKLLKAVRDRWGDASREAFPDIQITDVPGAVEKIDGDIASILFHGTVVTRLKKVDGHWKMDLVTPLSDMEMDSPKEALKAAGYYERAVNKTITMVAEGKCTSSADAHQAFDEAYDTEFNGIAKPSTRQAATQPGK